MSKRSKKRSSPDRHQKDQAQRKRRSIAVGSIVVGLGVLVGAVATIRGLLPPAPGLSVETFTVVEVPRQYEARYSDDPDAPADDTWEEEVAAIRIGFRNDGAAPAYVTRAILTFRVHEVLETCVQIGDEVYVTASIDIDIPYDPEPVPWTHEEPVDFRVAPNDLDRLELTLNVQDLPPFPGPAIYSVDVMVEDDSGREPFEAGTARLLLPIPNVKKALDELTEHPYAGTIPHVRPDEGCPESNLALMREVAASPALPRLGSTPHFRELLSALEDYEAGEFYVRPTVRPRATGTPSPLQTTD